jgi:hypothetical protein
MFVFLNLACSAALLRPEIAVTDRAGIRIRKWYYTKAFDGWYNYRVIFLIYGTFTNGSKCF